MACGAALAGAYDYSATLMRPLQADHSLLARDIGTTGATKLSIGPRAAFHPHWLTEFK
jgi:hypothetical protein